MDAVTIREARKEDLEQSKTLIKNGLHEHYIAFYKYATLKSIRVQISIILASWLFAAMTFPNLLTGGLVFVAVQTAAFLYMRNFWFSYMDRDMTELDSWSTFSALYCSDDFNRFWVAVDGRNSQIIGTVALIRRPKRKTEERCGFHVPGYNKYMTEDEFSATAELKRMSVAPEYRGKGLSQLLMAKVYEHVEEQRNGGLKVSKLSLLVHCVLFAARKFYKRNGFKHVESWPIPYYGGLSYASHGLFVKYV